MSEPEEYRRVREKVIGMTFQMQQQEDEAVDIFIGQTTDTDVRQFLADNREIVLSIFQQSQTHNLRILKQTIWAWDRFYTYIRSDHRDRQKGMIAAFKLFVALSIEVRSGRISADDLTDRVEKVVAGQRARRDDESSKGTPLSRAQAYYPQLYLHDSVLTDEVLVQVLCEGRHDGAAINEALSKSEYFIQPEDETAWRRVAYGITRMENEFEAAFAEMETQFKNRKFVQAGEVLHVFGLRLWCSEIGHLSLTADEVVDECRTYVDNLYKSEKILASSTGAVPDGPMMAAYGLVIERGNDQAFGQLYQYYVSRLKEAEHATSPKHVDDLMGVMATDSDVFFQKVCWTNDDRENTFAHIPIFSSVSAQRFVDCLLSVHPSDQRTILTALNGRYGSGALGQELAEEREWLTEVRDQLRERANNMSPIRQYAIRNEVGRLLDPVLGDELDG